MHEIKVGDVSITSIIERDGPWRTPEAMFPNWDPEAGPGLIEGLEPEMFDAVTGKMVITYQTFVVRTPSHTILVDTCLGEDKGWPPPLDFPTAPWRDGFDALGLEVEDIDYVFCTHLHFDHCGWNTQLRDGEWVPTFPNATYVFHEREYSVWEESKDEGDMQSEVWARSCAPVVAAGRASLVSDDFTLDDTARLVPTPGHSPGHYCLEITSGGERAVLTGDLFHHALQVRAPELFTIFCWDPAQAVDARTRWLASIAGTNAIVLPTHFPQPVAGRIVESGAGLDYRYLRG